MFARNEKIAKTCVLRPFTANRRSAVFRQECDSGVFSKIYMLGCPNSGTEINP